MRDATNTSTTPWRKPIFTSWPRSFQILTSTGFTLILPKPHRHQRWPFTRETSSIAMLNCSRRSTQVKSVSAGFARKPARDLPGIRYRNGRFPIQQVCSICSIETFRMRKRRIELEDSCRHPNFGFRLMTPSLRAKIDSFRGFPVRPFNSAATTLSLARDRDNTGGRRRFRFRSGSCRRSISRGLPYCTSVWLRKMRPIADIR